MAKKKTPKVAKRGFLRTRTQNDVYKVWVHMVVAPSMNDARIAVNQFTGKNDQDDRFGAVAMFDRDRNAYAMVFRRDYMDHGVIAHEVFHIAHRILEHAGDDFKPTNHEPYSYIVEWITVWVYKQLKKAKIRVS